MSAVPLHAPPSLPLGPRMMQQLDAMHVANRKLIDIVEEAARDARQLDRIARILNQARMSDNAALRDVAELVRQSGRDVQRIECKG